MNSLIVSIFCAAVIAAASGCSGGNDSGRPQTDSTGRPGDTGMTQQEKSTNRNPSETATDRTANPGGMPGDASPTR